jgi:hypothetical protein
MGEKANEEKGEKNDLSKEQLDRCIPVARKVLSFIADAGLPIGDIKKETASDDYDKAIKSILQLLLDENLRVNDVEMVIALMLQPVDLVGKGIDHSLKINLKQASEKVWKKSPDEVTLQEVDALLKS